MQFSLSACSVQGELLIDGSFLSPSAFSHQFQFSSLTWALADGEQRAGNLAGTCADAIFQQHVELGRLELNLRHAYGAGSC
jgi:hypothetical protein